MSDPRLWTPIGTPLPERIRRMSVINLDTGCWEWLATRNADGYGSLRVDGRHMGSHRASYEAFVGPIPDGMTVDHLCFVRHCVNPEHLRLLTRPENCGNQRPRVWTHCKQGHELTEQNTVWRAREGGGLRRRCRICRHAEGVRQAEKRKAATRMKLDASDFESVAS